jgi:hypothetical protein
VSPVNIFILGGQHWEAAAHFCRCPTYSAKPRKREDVGLGPKSAPPEVILQPDQASPAMDCLRIGFRGNTAAGERSGSSVITHEALLIAGMRRARRLVASPPPEPPAHSSRSPASFIAVASFYASACLACHTAASRRQNF